MTQLNTKDPRDLLIGSDSSLSEYLGVDQRTIKRYKSLGALPAASMKLLQLRHGDLSGIFGKEWDGFTVGHDGKLYPPYFRGGFSALDISAMFFQVQELAYLRNEVKRLTAAAADHAAKEKAAKLTSWAADKVKSFTVG